MGVIQDEIGFEAKLPYRLARNPGWYDGSTKWANHLGDQQNEGT